MTTKQRMGRLGRVIVTALCAIASAPLPGAQEEFEIHIVRMKPKGELLPGMISVGKEVIGRCYENASLRIPAGIYKGVLRYWSPKGFAQGPFGELGKTGDFLLEVADVKAPNGTPRTDILFHGGDKPHQSQGCILLGPVVKTAKGGVVDDKHPLRILRLKFYGTDSPIASPDKAIRIIVTDPP
jgi:Family of unknown function (DUF5675)